MNQLVPHPGCAAGSITGIAASIEPTEHGCRAVFVAQGDITRIAVPVEDQSGRFDNLWKTTCFEIFWSHDGSSYREFNLSPSGRWACYDFDGFREGMRNAPAEVVITMTVSNTEFFLYKVFSGQAMTIPTPTSFNTFTFHGLISWYCILYDTWQ